MLRPGSHGNQLGFLAVEGDAEEGDFSGDSHPVCQKRSIGTVSEQASNIHHLCSENRGAEYQQHASNQATARLRETADK
ncbi:hypothetical protein GCM10007907_35930 [Chitinimonas prasina]|uniref:Uncharacterized protein n=1 Tax=Chitinimonas prasina TaxID=1434937 RepID=A0ABQ5YK26_9NEIS|nr:hypothetical protein GCM10007907_35930 [Chitinimonas prasina]